MGEFGGKLRATWRPGGVRPVGIQHQVHRGVFSIRMPRA